MTKRLAKRSDRRLTDEERSRMREIRAQVEQDLPELMAKGRALKAAHRQSRSILEQLKALRLAQGLSLQQMQERTGIGRAALSKLERAEHANPTLATLSRYASALGKNLAIDLVDPN